MLVRAWPPTTPELGSSPVRVGRGEWRTMKPMRRSLGLERRHDGWVTMANQRRQRSSEVVMLELGEEGRRAGMGAVRTGQGPQPFIEVGGRQRHRGGFNGRPWRHRLHTVKRGGGIYD
jgi:hypothetical protein